MKKVIAVAGILLTSSLVYVYFNQIQEREYNSTDWKVYKVEDKKVQKRTPTKNELISVRIPEKKKLPSNPKVTLPMRDGRRLLGSTKDVKSYSDESIDLEFINVINENWKEDLADRILKSQRPDTDIFIKRESSLIQIRNNKGRYMEHVLLAVKRPGDLKQSYEAMVDSETGKIIKTWNSIIYEKKSKKAFSDH